MESRRASVIAPKLSPSSMTEADPERRTPKSSRVSERVTEPPKQRATGGVSEPQM
jgi:hypothetical protein